MQLITEKIINIFVYYFCIIYLCNCGKGEFDEISACW